MTSPPSEAQPENLAVGRQLVELYERRGVWGIHERFDEFFHSDFAWKPAISQFGEDVYIGRDGFARWISDIEAVTTEVLQTDIQVQAVGERHLLTLGTMRIVGRESGAAFESEYGSVYEMEDGRAKSGRAFLTHADAERAAEEAQKTALEADRKDG